ncbi:hypothetical protein ACEWY4_001012 [Coilia grayii]|uniref:Bcl-2 Bcl-2 homology region 1-3 domain-containing protein n=1 Tax=Coilia grayii TaxID=363190 RepID=A0ABD1KYB2_9TELE
MTEQVMAYSNRELVMFYINFKLNQKNYPVSLLGLANDTGRTERGQMGGESELGPGATAVTTMTTTTPTTTPTTSSPLPNGSANGTSSQGGTPTPPQRSPTAASSSSAGLDAVKEALRDSANEFELRYARAFSDLSSQLHITPATAYQSFESVMDEVFRDGVNWGRVVGLFAFGGALCVECVEKEMSSLVGRIADWMTVYLDEHIQPWIQSQGGWDYFMDLKPNDASSQHIG